MTRIPVWWGSFQVPLDTATRWRIGPLVMWIERLRSEWRVAQTLPKDGQATAVQIEPAAPHADLLGAETLSRFAVHDDDTTVHLAPRLADRPVVASPERAMFVPPGQVVTVYVGSPIWLRVTVGREGAITLQEQAIYQPSDTWFGPTTTQGELCYASRTAARLRLEEVELRPHRALTAVVIDNQADDVLQLEKLKLPVAYLSLYADAHGVLRTEDITLVRRANADLLPLRIGKGPPRHAAGAKRLAPPRETPTESLLVRAFETLFSRARTEGLS